jgi:RimJ/RimL family protein N-acetyltransferase
MKFVPLTRLLADQIAYWFDDPDTVRYLGDRAWLDRELDLVQTAPGAEFRGRRILARHVWVAFTPEGEPCALIDVEPYEDGTAGIALVVAPQARGRGLGQQVLRALATRPELNGVRKIIGAFEPDNLAARYCYERAGFRVAATLDEEGFFQMEKEIKEPGGID